MIPGVGRGLWGILRPEVISLKDDAIWQAFASTGDPLYYLLYKTAEEREKKKKKSAAPGPAPRPAD